MIEIADVQDRWRCWGLWHQSWTRFVVVSRQYSSAAFGKITVVHKLLTPEINHNILPIHWFWENTFYLQLGAPHPPSPVIKLRYLPPKKERKKETTYTLTTNITLRFHVIIWFMNSHILIRFCVNTFHTPIPLLYCHSWACVSDSLVSVILLHNVSGLACILGLTNPHNQSP